MGAGSAAEMRVSSDLSKILEEWPYEPGQISVRLIQGDDGEPRIQLRVDLGILQMFVDGRPDGQRPRGHESLLEYHESRLDQHEGEHGSTQGFVLSGDECRELREEAVQYYHRYVCLTVLEDFDRVIRDTQRNLRVLDLCAEHAEAPEDRQILEQFRPYITMMRTRALASQAVKENEPKAAVHALEEGLETLRRQLVDVGGMEAFESSPEVQALQTMREALVPKLPLSQTAELKRRLADAIAKENYELAAILRDEINMLKDP